MSLWSLVSAIDIERTRVSSGSSACPGLLPRVSKAYLEETPLPAVVSWCKPSLPHFNRCYRASPVGPGFPDL